MTYLIRIHTERQHLSYISDLNSDSLNDEQLATIKDEIISILTYGELLCDLYFQLKTNQKPLEGRYENMQYIYLKYIQDFYSKCITYFKFFIVDLLYSIIGGDFCSLWIGSINDALSLFDFKDDYVTINIRFIWLKAIFHMQDKETELTCDVLDMVTKFLFI